MVDGGTAFAEELRLLVVLELTSAMCFIQVATLTHGVFAAIPLTALLVAAAIRLHSRPQVLLEEPLCILYPDNQSRHGLACEQKPSTRFVAFASLLKLLCCGVFLANLAGLDLFEDLCPDSVPSPSCANFFSAPHSFYCMDIWSFMEKPDAKRKHLYRQKGDPCWGQCATNETCGPQRVNLRAAVLDGNQLAESQFCHSPCELDCCQCLHCELSPAVPSWLKEGCTNGAFAPNIAPDELYLCLNSTCATQPQPLPYYQEAAWSAENKFLAQLARCALTHGKDGHEVRVVLSIVAALQFLPSVSLVLFLSLGILWPLLNGEHVLSMLGDAPADSAAIQNSDAKATILRDEIRRKRLQASTKERGQLYMELVLFLLDYVSDYNCLVQFLLEGQYATAAIQAVIIAAPLALDCYRGKIQLVEVAAGFCESRSKGFPTNKLILALRSEKSIEAPLSFCLQNYTLLRATSSMAVYSLCLSMPLSIVSMAKHVYNTFELQMLNVPIRPAPPTPEESNAVIGLAYASEPNYPPGFPAHVVPLAPPAFPFASQPNYPPGLMPPAHVVPLAPTALTPITLNNQKVKDTE